MSLVMHIFNHSRCTLGQESKKTEDDAKLAAVCAAIRLAEQRRVYFEEDRKNAMALCKGGKKKKNEQQQAHHLWVCETLFNYMAECTS